MKQMKIALVAILAVLMGTTFTSCLDSDGESSWDFADYVTLNYDNTYTCDNSGYVITITNKSTVFSAGYPQRGFFYFKLAEGETITENKKNYSASVYDGTEIMIKNFCNRLDTLNIDNDVNPYIHQMNGVWPTYNYLNVGFRASISSSTKLDYFNLFPDRVEGNTLYLTLHHDQEDRNTITANGDVVLDFNLPYASDLENMLGTSEYSNLDFFGSNNDSINVVIEGFGSSGTVKSKSVAVRIRRIN